METKWGVGVANIRNRRASVLEFYFGNNTKRIFLPFRLKWFPVNPHTDDYDDNYELYVGDYTWGDISTLKLQRRMPNIWSLIHMPWEYVFAKSLIFMNNNRWKKHSSFKQEDYKNIRVYSTRIDENNTVFYIRSKMVYRIKALKLLPFFSQIDEKVVPKCNDEEFSHHHDIALLRPGIITLDKGERFNEEAVASTYRENKTMFQLNPL